MVHLNSGDQPEDTSRMALREHDTLYGSTYDELTSIADVRRLELDLSRFMVLRVIRALRHLGRMS